MAISRKLNDSTGQITRWHDYMAMNQTFPSLDFNDYTSPGVYGNGGTNAGFINAPSGADNGFLIVSGDIQIWLGNYRGRICVRKKSGGTWTDWTTLWGGVKPYITRLCGLLRHLKGGAQHDFQSEERPPESVDKHGNMDWRNRKFNISIQSARQDNVSCEQRFRLGVYLRNRAYCNPRQKLDRWKYAYHNCKRKLQFYYSRFWLVYDPIGNVHHLTRLGVA